MGKKFWALIIACLIITCGYIAAYYGYTGVRDWSKDIFHTIWFFIAGQGAADWGKEAKKLEIQRDCDEGSKE